MEVIQNALMEKLFYRKETNILEIMETNIFIDK